MLAQEILPIGIAPGIPAQKSWTSCLRLKAVFGRLADSRILPSSSWFGSATSRSSLIRPSATARPDRRRWWSSPCPSRYRSAHSGKGRWACLNSLRLQVPGVTFRYCIATNHSPAIAGRCPNRARHSTSRWLRRSRVRFEFLTETAPYARRHRPLSEPACRPVGARVIRKGFWHASCISTNAHSRSRAPPVRAPG